MDEKRPQIGSGTLWKPVDQVELDKDTVGFTHPNLHRRLDAKQPTEGEDELLPRSYKVSITGLDSIRTTEVHTYSDDSQSNDIP